MYLKFLLIQTFSEKLISHKEIAMKYDLAAEELSTKDGSEYIQNFIYLKSQIFHRTSAPFYFEMKFHKE